MDTVTRALLYKATKAETELTGGGLSLLEQYMDGPLDTVTTQGGSILISGSVNGTNYAYTAPTPKITPDMMLQYIIDAISYWNSYGPANVELLFTSAPQTVARATFY